jgi:hypothetical protein
MSYYELQIVLPSRSQDPLGNEQSRRSASSHSVDAKQSFSTGVPKQSLGTRFVGFPIILVIAATLTGALRADEVDDDMPRLPVIGRPDFFDAENGPIGSFQTPVVQASPTDVQVEDPITLTIRVQAAGKVYRAPKQIRLENFPEIAEQFYVEYPDDATFRRIDDRTWEFTCTLKPRRTNVSAIPSFPFAFFVPELLPPERGYQNHRTASIPITVRPRPLVQPSEVVRGVESQPLPDSVYRIAEGPAVLSYSRPVSPLVWIVLGGICLILPAMKFFIGQIVWPRFSTNAKRKALVRRSIAAKKALAALDRLPREADISGAATIVAHYLRERFDLGSEEPTPDEVQCGLTAVGYESPASEMAGDFYRLCDAARYGHVAPSQNAAIIAREVIITLEAGPCPVSSSS